MFNNSPYAVAVSSFQSPVPSPRVDPAEGPFVYVAINRTWLPYVMGCLKQLLLQTTWIEQDDDTLNLTQQQAFKILQMFTFAGDNPTGFLPDCPPNTGDMEYEMSICEQLRFNNGVLQGFCCGEWVNIAGQGPNQGIGHPDQPGSGQPQPTPGGGCQTYHAKLSANSGWKAPTGVSTGDVITVSNANGGWYDGGYSPWNCPDGNSFFLNNCIPGTGGPSAGDPFPTGKHMSLVVEIAGTWYDTISPITVPGGVSNAEVNFQANDTVLSDNGGDITFDVEVCNNQLATWSRSYVFTTDVFGWSGVSEPGNTPSVSTLWSAGNGFVAGGAVGGGYHQHASKIDRVFSSPITITDAIMTFRLVKGSPIDGGFDNALILDLAGSGVYSQTEASTMAVDGSARTLQIPHGSYVIDEIAMIIYDAVHAGAITPGTSAILQLDLQGVGTPPTP